MCFELGLGAIVVVVVEVAVEGGRDEEGEMEVLGRVVGVSETVMFPAPPRPERDMPGPEMLLDEDGDVVLG